MSLIEDALRRVQDPVVTAGPQQNSTPRAPAPAAPKKGARPESEPAAHSWSLSPPALARAPRGAEAPMLVAAAVIGLTVVLAIAAMFWMGRRLHQAAAPAAAPALQPAVSPAPAAAIDPAVPRVRGHQTAAPVAAANTLGGPSLTGIIEGLGKPCAMINAGIVCLGERVGTATLVAIGDRQVTLEQPDGSLLTLQLPR